MKYVSFAIAKDISKNFSFKNDVVFCNDISCLIEALGLEYDPTEWCLFVDSSKVSLKAVLLHNGNKFPSLLVTLGR